MPRKTISSRKKGKTSAKPLYLIPSLSRALDILELLRVEGTPLSLEQIYQRTKFSKTTVYRVLQTLSHRGYASKTDDGAYRIVNAPRKLRFGFGSESADMPFSEAVTESLRAAAASACIDLMVLDNRYDGAVALQNADEFIRAKVDLIVEFQIDRHAAPVIGDKIAAAGIPLIAIDIPHAHATYFGIDNYRAGLEAGEYLATFAAENWNGKVDWVLALELEEAGTLVQSRMSGCLDAMRSVLPKIPPERYVRVDARGMREKSQRIVAEFLAAHPREQILIAAHTDTSALGALAAVRKARRERNVAIVGQDCLPEIMEEMARPCSPMIGSVSHEVHEYGPRIIELGLAILQGKSVPPYNYANHKLITQKMVRLKRRA
jgi:ribose transport system substrate-binding protein